MFDTFHPGLAALHERLGLALRWGGVLLALSALLPVGREAGETLWLWNISAPGPLLAALSPLVAGLALLFLGRMERWSALARGGLGLALAGIVLPVASAFPETRASLLAGLPLELRNRAPWLVLALVLGGAAAAWRTGPRDGSHRIGRRLAGLALAALALLLFLPVHGGTLVGALWEGVAFAFRPWAPTSRLLVNVLLVLLPPAMALAQAVRSLTEEGPATARTAWTVGLPCAVAVMWSAKLAALSGQDLQFALGLRGGIQLGVVLAIGIHGLVAMLSQLFDRHVPEVLADARLLRDALVHRAVREEAPLPPVIGEDVRPFARRLAQERLESLAAATRRARIDPIARRLIRLRVSGVPQDEVEALDPAALEERAGAVREREVPRAVWWLARGRRLEAVAAGVAAIVLAALALPALLRARPVAPTWELGEPPEWATHLYRRRLPAFAVHAGEDDGPALAEEVEAAARDAASVPALAAALRSLGALVLEPGPNRRAIGEAGAAINTAARLARLPFYVDVNVRSTARRRGVSHIFYVKTYRVTGVRPAGWKGGSWAVLWLERLDRLNIVERRLGWTKPGDPFATVVLDVVREYRDAHLVPALEGTRDSSHLAAEELRRELIAGLAADGVPEAAAALEESLGCDDDDAACARPAGELREHVTRLLARMVEQHELQHAIDTTDGLEVPDEVWRLMEGYEEESVAFTAGELSAYLAEVARAPRPRLALAHFLDVCAAARGTPEWFAGRAAERWLSADALSLSDDELRSRARRAWGELFGGPLPEPGLTP